MTLSVFLKMLKLPLEDANGSWKTTVTKTTVIVTLKSTEKLMHAFITSRLDSCNPLLVGLIATTLKPLARVQNCAARVVLMARNSEHITPILKVLHWLPVDYRIQFKGLLLFYSLSLWLYS